MSSDQHDHGGDELTECPDCGAEIAGEASVTAKSVPELTVERRHAYVGRRGTDLWMCKQCGATLGVKR
ncbi:hypothetical protein [Halogeometricum limi]|uniref:Uncharacterized protein n=1 Tax=Halogeometricum limi TaxID=555875 RepID=A0A1I6IQN5_9EURY|nr:hypothetical protein [Halogeometricum limi]SFR68939.1 hypothetical protein SAMN04488124_3502 [Halogeometricum limi]